MKNDKLFWNRGLAALLNLCIAVMVLACADFVEVDLPSNQQTGTSVFQELKTAEAALTNIYAIQREEGLLSGSASGISNAFSLYADELELNETASGSAAEFATHTLSPATPLIQTMWANTYQSIYATNAVIEGLVESTSLTPEQRDPLVGEAFFLRGLLYFYLNQLFGAIPYVTTTDYTANSRIEKSDAATVTNLILADLEQATNLLPENYSNTERTRPNRFVAQLVSARVHLYAEHWEQAASLASSVINSGLYSLNVPIDEVFKRTSAATLWQFKPEQPGYNTYEAQSFILLTAPPTGNALREAFLNSFEAGDLRVENWMGSVSDGTSTWYFPYKYQEYSPTKTSQEYSKVIRLAEAYLIRAEAQLRKNDFSGARDDLNHTRSRAGLPALSTLDPNVLEDALVYERKAEFFTEYGHRWFDLKRWGRAEALLENLKPGWGISSYLLPLPETELQANPNLLPQNPGY